MAHYDLFIDACKIGNLNRAIELKDDVNIHANNDEAFRLSCEDGHIEVAKWLYTLDSIIYELEIENNRIIKWNIKDKWHDINEALKMNDTDTILEKLNIVNTINLNKVDDCLICHESDYKQIQLSCKHNYCVKCIISWAITSKQKNYCKCPYCMKRIEWHNNLFISLS